MLGAEAVESRPDELRYFAEDSLGRRGGSDDGALPLAIVRPASPELVAATLKLASRLDIPVVPFGSGTGLMGGARSLKPGIVLDTNNLGRINVQASDRMVWAGAGAVLADVDAALRQHGLCLGHDPWTFPVATVGGVLSTNGLGYRGGRYGGAGAQALALEVALPDGTLFRTRALRRHSAGPRLERLFIGAEGTLGVITAAALEAFPIPERQELRGFRFDRFEHGFAAVNAIVALGLRPSLLDYGEAHQSPWPDLTARQEEPPVLYLGFEGAAEEVEGVTRRAESIARESGGALLPAAIVQGFWDERHVVAERFRRGQPRRRGGFRDPNLAFDYIHVALPPSAVLAFRDLCHAEAARSGVALLECGLWTAPDFFSAVLALPASPGGHERLNAVIDELLRAAQDAGGSMEYVHGAGLRLAHLMQREHGSGLDVLRRLKAALDPAGILNPGKLDL